MRAMFLALAALVLATACGATTPTLAPTSAPPSPIPPTPGASVSPGAASPPAASAPPSAAISPTVSSPPEPTATAGSFPTSLVLGQTFALVYDPVLERVVLVNGAVEDAPPRPTELWGWSGTAWELIDAAGPPARSFGAVARDPDRGVIVVHGGLTADGTPLDETLEWDGRDWSVRTWTDEGPGAREGAGLAWDEAGERLLLFGGAVEFEQLADTWAWNGTAWTQVATTGPPPRFVSLMTDTRLGGILLHGGHWVDGNDGGFFADTWSWDGERWLEEPATPAPGPRVNSPGVWDTNREGIVLFGGGTGFDTPLAGDTWLWNGAWSELEMAIAPSARNGHAMAFDERRGVLVLVGGLDRPGGSQRLDVWELDADGWREVTPAG